MAIAQDLNSLKTKEQELTQNKVSRFAYTQNAYDNDTVTGVSDYVPSRDMNVPLGTAEIMKVNPTIPDKGWRAQASAITRMLMNHFLGRISYNLNKVHDNFLSFLTSLQGSLGTANGIATLDENGRIPYSQLPESAIEYKGTWNAATNTPTLADGTGTLGDMYIVSVAGTQNLGSGSISFDVGDRVLYDGSVWQKLSSGGGGDVASVNNVLPDPVTKNVEVKADDIETEGVTAPDISNLGKTWTQSNKTNGIFRTVYHADGIWVAGGTSTGLWWSNDGKTWTQSNKTNGSFLTVYYADGIWVAGGSAVGLWWSNDGKTWTQSDKTNGIFQTVYHAGVIWVAGSESMGLWWSNDGKAWTQSNKTNGIFFTVYYADGIWLAGGDDSTGLWWSNDGKTWAQNFDFTGITLRTVYYADGIWVAEPDSMGLVWSNDGNTWTRSNKTDGTFLTVYYADGIWVAGGDSIGLWWSNDGKTWTQSNKTDGYSLTIYHAGGIWVAGISSSGLWWSNDGKSWTQSDKTDGSFLTVYYADGIWVAGGVSIGLWYSVPLGMTKDVEKILAYLLLKVG